MAHQKKQTIDSRLLQNRPYLDLLKRSLNNYLYLGGNQTPEKYLTLQKGHYQHFEWKISKNSRPMSLQSIPQFEQLQKIIVSTIRNDVPGDFIEAGAWNGGTAIFMAGILKVLQATNRKLWIADSFRGIPRSTRVQGDPVDGWKDRWVSSYATVLSNFERYGVLGKNIRFLRGSFTRTLPVVPIRRLALARLDADSYESTEDALNWLYPKISVGGFIYIDDWHLPGCRQAVLGFRRRHGITEPIDDSLRAMWKVRNPWCGKLPHSA